MKKNVVFKIFVLIIIFIFIQIPSVAAENQISKKGSIKSNTGTNLNLRIDYEITQLPIDKEITVLTKVYLEYFRLRINDERIGTLTVNGEKAEFKTGRIWIDEDKNHALLVLTKEFKFPHEFNAPLTLDFSAKWELGGTYSGKHVGVIEAKDSIKVDDTPTGPVIKKPVTNYRSIFDTPKPIEIETPAVIEPEIVTAYDMKKTGTVYSHTGTYLQLRVDWVAEQNRGDANMKVTANVYIDYIRMLGLPERNGEVNINGDIKKFNTPPMNVPEEVNHTTLIATHVSEIKHEYGTEFEFPISAKWYLGTNYTDTRIDWVEAIGTAVVTDKYDSIPKTSNINIPFIEQMPELPNGCEVTSLAMVLQNLGYDADKLEINDKYLDIGEIGATDYYKANIGNPRDANSFGSYSPVIYNCAAKYLKDHDDKHKVYDITGYGISELYYQVSKNVPVIVWITQDINKKPLVTKTWVIDGVNIHWKAPLHCVVLTGFDFDNKTVTVVDPHEGVVKHPMDVFELRWREMGSQGVIVK